MYAGLLKVPHGSMLVMFWCLYSSNAYGARYERIDALRPMLAIGLLFAVLFALASGSRSSPTRSSGLP